MDQPDRGAEPNFTQPLRQILLMLVTLGLVGAGLWVVLPLVLPVFTANLYLNGAIVVVFVIGLFATLWQVWQISRAVGWINSFVRGEVDGAHPPRLLAPLAQLKTRGRMQLGATSTRSILDSVATRIDEERDITRYITNLLILFGLLGTFFGLATTVPAVVDTIRSLAPAEGEGGVEVFDRLMSGLEAQLGGMGTAFSSSLIGLSGSLVVGLLELFATHGQNRFYRELEEWLSSITRLGFAPGESEAGGEMGAASAWLGHVASQVEEMQLMFQRAEENRAMLDARMVQLVASVDRLTHQSNTGENTAEHLARIAQQQERLIELMERREGAAEGDAESRMHLRSIDVQMLRVLEEMSAGRQESMAEIRGDIAALTRAIRQTAGN